MDSAVPKQFLLLADKPMLMHSLTAFAEVFPGIQILLALPPEYFGTWDHLCQKYCFEIQHQVVEGGKTRFHSVKNALSSLHHENLIAVHDGARPLISHALISRSFNAAYEFGNAIPSIAVTESLRFSNGIENHPVDRNQYRIIQTPQVFNGQLLKKAYNTEFRESFTDDATVVENLGEKIHLIEGETINIKITKPTDLVAAELLFARLNQGL